MSRVTVTGEVTRVFSKGFDLTETYVSRDNREFSQRFTVWESGPMQGDRVTVEGDLSLSVEDWTGRDGQTRHSVKASINRPTITAGSTLDRSLEARDNSQGADGWDAPGTYDTETPF